MEYFLSRLLVWHLLVGEIFDLAGAEDVIVRRRLEMSDVVIFFAAFQGVELLVHVREGVKELFRDFLRREAAVGAVIVVDERAGAAPRLPLFVQFISSGFGHGYPPLFLL